MTGNPSPINLKVLLESQALERAPFPIPVGWYHVCYSDTLARGEMRNVQMLGQEWVLFRNESGRPGVTDPYCPHLGAHIGHGGKVVGDNVRCPFHHWEYDPEGWCRKIPYAKVMPPVTKQQAILRTLPTVEKYGMVWSWYHPLCEAPSWELPYIPELEDAEGYVGSRRGSWTADTCIQELAENGVDVAHLRFLHNTSVIPPVTATYDGHRMNLDIGKGYIVSEMHGPCLSIVRFTQEGITSTMISYSLPIARDKTQMNMSFRHVDYAPGTKELASSLKVIDHMIGAAEGEVSAGFESVDFIVWNNKKFRPNPLLCDGDGPILPYRNWFKQFYVEPQA